MTNDDIVTSTFAKNNENPFSASALAQNGYFEMVNKEVEEEDDLRGMGKIFESTERTFLN